MVFLRRYVLFPFTSCGYRELMIGLSRAWKDLKKKEKWGADFTIKLLDEWSEQLVEVGDGD